MKSDYSKKYFPPAVSRNILLRFAIPFTYVLFVLMIVIDSVSKKNGGHFKITSIEFLIITIFFIFIWLLFYIFIKRLSIFFVCDTQNLYLKKANTTLKEFSLESFSHFLIETTTSLEASGGFMQIELFAVDIDGSRQRLVKNDFGDNLLKSWQKFMTKFSEASKKKFQFRHYVVDLDGERYDSEKFKAIQWKKRIPLFKSPYK